MDSLEAAKLARGDQGSHETEVSFGGESDLQRHFIDCDKNPGHDDFIAVTDFNVNQLPERYRDPDIVNYILAQAELTVRITSNYTSVSRPDGYSFSNYKGTHFTRTGTGFIQYVYRNEGRSDKPCPCPLCKASGNPQKEWAKIKVRTATHVVFDDEEAKNTVVELFYDNEKEKKTKVVKVYGDNVRFGAIQGDWCDMRCVTHDLDLCDYLKDAWGRWRWLEMKINEKYCHSSLKTAMVSTAGEFDNGSSVAHKNNVKDSCYLEDEHAGSQDIRNIATGGTEFSDTEQKASNKAPDCGGAEPHRLAIVVSHPHGCNKQISIGQWVDRQVIGNSKGWENCVYGYNTPTCPGSSGAPVWLLGRVKWGGFFGRHPHSSGKTTDGLNRSGVGWDKVV